MIILWSVHNRVQWVRVAWLELLCWQHAPAIIDTLNTSLHFSLWECVAAFYFSHWVICSASQPNNILFILSAPTDHRSTDGNLRDGLFITGTVEWFTESLVLLTMCCVGYTFSYQWQHLRGGDVVKVSLTRTILLWPYVWQEDGLAGVTDEGPLIVYLDVNKILSLCTSLRFFCLCSPLSACLHMLSA